jgi:hypothetical protein
MYDVQDIVDKILQNIKKCSLFSVHFDDRIRKSIALILYPDSIQDLHSYFYIDPDPQNTNALQHWARNFLT